MTDPPRREALCEVTGKPCRWLSEEWEPCDDYPDGAWDLFCSDCYRWRDWSLEEAEEPAEGQR